MRRKKRERCFGWMLAAAAALFIVTGSCEDVFLVQAAAEENARETAQPVTIAESELYAQSAVLMDAASGRILFEKAGEEFRSNASTTKILTCIVALENGNPEDMVAVSEYAASMPDVQLNMNAGEYYRLGDLLYSLMLESHNDSAVAIAEHVGGSVEGFAKMMNAKAGEIGCTNTFFVTPNGLDQTVQVTMEDGSVQEKRHGTTARDLALIMSYCVLSSPKKDAFLEITRTPSYTFSSKQPVEGADGQFTDGSRSFSCTNHNAYLQMDAEALSGKTGFTSAAGYCYVGAVQSQGRTFVVSLLACGWPNNRSYKWSDCKTLFSYAREYYHYRPLTAMGITFRDVEITGAQNEAFALEEKLWVTPEADLSMEILLADWEEITVNVQYPGAIPAPVSGRQTIGTLEVSIDGIPYAASEITVEREAVPRDMAWYVRAVLAKWLDVAS